LWRWRNVKREKLSPEKRRLGDDYVKKEFRDHRQGSPISSHFVNNSVSNLQFCGLAFAAKPEFVRAFIAEWSRYAHDLASKKDVGAQLPPELFSALSPEQNLILQRLEREARSLKKRT